LIRAVTDPDETIFLKLASVATSQVRIYIGYNIEGFCMGPKYNFCRLMGLHLLRHTKIELELGMNLSHKILR
jgi:hypothetical protein